MAIEKNQNPGSRFGATSNQIYIVTLRPRQLTQALFLQKN